MSIAEVDQAVFSEALLDPNRDTPRGLTDPEGRPADKRFSVYRNNVAVSLTEALITAFPTVHKLLGDEYYRAMAGVYLRKHPPKSPIMMHYGQEMPQFLKRFKPVQHLAYLSDISRLELALRASYHAADSAPIAPDALQTLPADRLMLTRLRLSPAVRVVRSDWPIHAIWLVNRDASAPKPVMQPQDVLITRPEFDPVVTRLDAGGGAFVSALLEGKSFGVAYEAGTSEHPDFDLSGTLGHLINGAAIIELDEGTIK